MRRRVRMTAGIPCNVAASAAKPAEVSSPTPEMTATASMAAATVLRERSLRRQKEPYNCESKNEEFERQADWAGTLHLRTLRTTREPRGTLQRFYTF
jgi:hypothetical protein